MIALHWRPRFPISNLSEQCTVREQTGCRMVGGRAVRFDHEPDASGIPGFLVSVHPSRASKFDGGALGRVWSDLGVRLRPPPGCFESAAYRPKEHNMLKSVIRISLPRRTR